MPLIIYIIVSSFLISLGSLIGVFSLAAKKEFLEKILLFLVAISAGTLMGGAFFHLIPEAAEKLNINELFSLILASFVIFFIIEKIFHWRHCHQGECEIHSFGYVNLIGDSIHNFIDGLIIAAAFLTDIKLGIAASLAIASHEIPQEISDFGVLVYAGFKRAKALILNFLVALTVVLGGAVGYFLSFFLDKLIIYLLPLAAGGFLYIAAADLIPEIRKETNLKKSLLSFFFFLIGLVIMLLTRIIE